MKNKYIIGVAIALVFVVLALFSLDSSKVDYSDFSSARKSSETVQIIGEPLKNNMMHYDAAGNILRFEMQDDKDNKATVEFIGAKPNNFDIAPMVVIKGKFSGEVFKATEILTKCPSKYEGEMNRQ